MCRNFMNAEAPECFYPWLDERTINMSDVCRYFSVGITCGCLGITCGCLAHATYAATINTSSCAITFVHMAMTLLLQAAVVLLMHE
jgi:hypothetical protein